MAPRFRFRLLKILAIGALIAFALIQIRNIFRYPSGFDRRPLHVHWEGHDDGGEPLAQSIERLVTSSVALNHSKGYIPESSVCNFRTFTYLNNRQITLNQQPFASFAHNMKCILNSGAAVFGKAFAVFSGAVLDPTKTKTTRKGGEKMEDVWNQLEADEYFSFLPGYFKVPCKSPPSLIFDEKDHLSIWAKNLGCYGHSFINQEFNNTDYIPGITVAVQRYEYANLYHTMSDFYNAFVVKLLLHTRPERFNVLFVDAHPEGSLDPVWSALFGNVYRAGRLSKPTRFSKMVWGMLGYYSPLSVLSAESSVPYLEEFREFFLTRHGLNATRTINCQQLKAVIVWRRDYVAHPRNKDGKVVRKFSNEDEILQTVKDTLGPSANVEGVQLDKLTMKEQLSKISSCDILIGMHGAGLSHTIFLPKTSALIELFPAYSSILNHFQQMATWHHIVYNTWQNHDFQFEKDNAETYIKPEVIRDLVTSTREQLCH